MVQLIEKDLSYKLTGLCYEVHRELNRFCREKQYADSLEEKLKNANISYNREVFLDSLISNSVVGNKPDFIIENKIILDTKAKNFVTKEDYFQMQRYLHSAKLELGLIVNFRNSHLKPIRVLNGELGSFGCNSGHPGRIRGFTIIESLVAVAILLLALTGPMALAERSLASAEVARQELTVLYLAQEGMEFVRSVRDSNFLQHKGDKDKQDEKDKWLAGLGECLLESGCGVDLTKSKPIIACDVGNEVGNKECLLTQNKSSEKILAKGLFSHRFVDDRDGTWESSGIHRKICIVAADAGKSCAQDTNNKLKDANEVKVNVIMSWSTGRLGPRDLTVSSIMSNWYLSK